MKYFILTIYWNSDFCFEEDDYTLAEYLTNPEMEFIICDELGNLVSFSSDKWQNKDSKRSYFIEFKKVIDPKNIQDELIKSDYNVVDLEILNKKEESLNFANSWSDSFYCYGDTIDEDYMVIYTMNGDSMVVDDTLKTYFSIVLDSLLLAYKNPNLCLSYDLKFQQISDNCCLVKLNKQILDIEEDDSIKRKLILDVPGAIF